MALVAETGAVRVSVAVAGAVGSPVLEVHRLGLGEVVGVAENAAEEVGEAEVLPDTLPLLPPPSAPASGVKDGSSAVGDSKGVAEDAAPPPPDVTVGNSQGVRVKQKVGMAWGEAQGESHPVLVGVEVARGEGPPASLPMELREGSRDGVGASLIVAVPLIPPDLLAREVILGVLEG